MYKLLNSPPTLIVLLGLLGAVFGDYPCVCNNAGSAPVYDRANSDGTLIGYLHQLQCRPLHLTDNVGNMDYLAVQLENKVGYIENMMGTLSLAVCPGSHSLSDTPIVTTDLPIRISATSPPKRLSTTTLSTTSTTTLKSTHVPSTTATKTTTTVKSTTASTTSTSAHELRCPNNYIRKDQSCYLFRTHAHVTFGNATELCQEDNAHLVFIDSASEQQWLASHLEQFHFYSDLESKHRTALWIGGVFNHTSWEWVDSTTNTSTPITYTNWSPNWYPFYGDYQLRCASIVGADNSYWIDYNCFNKFHYICERSLSVQTVVTTQSPTTSSATTATTTSMPTTTATPTTTKATSHLSYSCPHDWDRHGTSCYYLYLLHHEPQPAAERRCEHWNENAHLAFVNSPIEQHFLQSYIKNHDDYDDKVIYIGGFKQNSTYNVWKSSHETLEMTYTNWAPHLHDGHCVIMSGKKDLHWNYSQCNNQHHFLCELELAPTAPALVG